MISTPGQGSWRQLSPRLGRHQAELIGSSSAFCRSGFRYAAPAAGLGSGSQYCACSPAPRRPASPPNPASSAATWLRPRLDSASRPPEACPDAGDFSKVLNTLATLGCRQMGSVFPVVRGSDSHVARHLTAIGRANRSYRAIVSGGIPDQGPSLTVPVVASLLERSTACGKRCRERRATDQSSKSLSEAINCVSCSD